MQVTLNPNAAIEKVTNVTSEDINATIIKYYKPITFTALALLECKNDENKTIIFRQLDDVQLIEIVNNSEFTVKG